MEQKHKISTQKPYSKGLSSAFRMPKTGVEPATYALRVRCSAN